MFSAFSAVVLVGRSFVCFFARSAVHYLLLYSALRTLIKQTFTPTTTSSMAV